MSSLDKRCNRMYVVPLLYPGQSPPVSIYIEEPSMERLSLPPPLQAHLSKMPHSLARYFSCYLPRLLGLPWLSILHIHVMQNVFIEDGRAELRLVLERD